MLQKFGAETFRQAIGRDLVEVLQEAPVEICNLRLFTTEEADEADTVVAINEQPIAAQKRLM